MFAFFSWFQCEHDFPTSASLPLQVYQLQSLVVGKDRKYKIILVFLRPRMLIGWSTATQRWCCRMRATRSTSSSTATSQFAASYWVRFWHKVFTNPIFFFRFPNVFLWLIFTQKFDTFNTFFFSSIHCLPFERPPFIQMWQKKILVSFFFVSPQSSVTSADVVLH